MTVGDYSFLWATNPNWVSVKSKANGTYLRTVHDRRSVDRKAAAGNTHPRKKKKKSGGQGKAHFPFESYNCFQKLSYFCATKLLSFWVSCEAKNPLLHKKKKMRLASKFPTKLLFLIIVSNFGNFKILSKGVNKKRRFLASFLIGNSWQNQWNGFFLLKSK